MVAGGRLLGLVEGAVVATPAAVEGRRLPLPAAILWWRCMSSWWGSTQSRVRLPESFAAVYDGRPPPGIWLQKEDYPNGLNWVHLEYDDAGCLVLTQGWRTFARAQRLETDQILHFRWSEHPLRGGLRLPWQARGVLFGGKQ